MVTAIIAITIIAIIAIQNWGEAQKHSSESAKYEAQAMSDLADAMDTIDGTVNTQKLILTKLQELYDTKNIQGVINEDS